MENRKIRILVVKANDGGCSYYRAISPFSILQEEHPDKVEIRVTDNPLQLDVKDGIVTAESFPPQEQLIDMNWADVVMINNILKFGGPYTARVCGIAKQMGKFVHFDTDDLLTGLYGEHKLYDVYKDNKLDDITKFVYWNSDLVTVTQSKFAYRIRPFCGKIVATVPNMIDYKLPCWNQQKVDVKYTRIGWALGIHHAPDVKEFMSVPHLVNNKVGRENVKWDFYGYPPPDPKWEKIKDYTIPREERERLQKEFDSDWQNHVWPEYKAAFFRGFKGQPNYQIFFAMPPSDYGVYVANMDICIAPLQMNDFNDSKCWRPNQKLLMYDGSFKEVKDIKVGDLTMGVDSKPRVVESTYVGKGNMVEIIPNRGKSFYMTENHILRLKTNDNNSLKWGYKPQYIELSVKDYLKSNTSTRYNYRLYRVPVNFQQSKEKLSIDPYFLGIMLGDGSFGNGSVGITTMDKEIENYFTNYCLSFGDDLKIRKNKKKNHLNDKPNLAATYTVSKKIRNCHIKNPVMKLFDNLGLSGIVCGDKYIPEQYKIASKEDRLQILAGLIDTDGYCGGGTVHGFTNKSKKLVEDTSFIARSLGLYVSPTTEFFIKETPYYSIRITGNIDIVPVKIPRKKGQPRRAPRDPLTSGFEIKYLGEEDCIGIQVSGDQLVIMDDFTVSHNSNIKVSETQIYKNAFVGSNVGTYSEDIENGKTGYLIDPGAPKTEWIRILSKLIKDKKHRIELGQNLYDKVHDKYDARKNSIDRIHLYHQAFQDTGFKLI